MKKVWFKRLSVFLSFFLLLGSLGTPTVTASSPIEKTYTTSNDFASGTSINVTTATPDQLQLDDTTKPFGFIWVAVSTKGTVV